MSPASMRAYTTELRSLGRREDGGPFTRARAGRAERSHALQMAGIILACLALAALSLLYPSTPTYDPWAWILWGREITQLDLVTEGGPSWKPFPVLFTAPFALFGQDIAPYLWLLVARAGGLFGCVMAYRMASRLIGGSFYGALAGVCAFLALFSSTKYVRDAALGNSEPLLAAIVLWAFERHLDGRRDHALTLGFLAALLRPEAWPFLGLYGLWLFLGNPELRARLVAFALLIPAFWFAPEWWGSGDPLRAGSRANAPNPGSAAFDDSPAMALLERFAAFTIAPVELGTIIAVGFAALMWLRFRREGATLVLTALGVAWFVLVAAMTEAGFAGNQRYLIVTTAVVSVLGGIGAVRILQGVERLAAGFFGARWARPVVLAAIVAGTVVASPTIIAKADNTARVQGGLEHEAYLWADLRGLIDEAGGQEALLACGGVFSGPFQTQMVAYELGIHGIQVGWKVTPPPGATFRTRTVPDGPLVTRPTDDRFRLVGTGGKWRLLTVPPDGRSDCPRASRYAPTVGTAGNTATKDAPLEVIGDPERPQDND